MGNAGGASSRRGRDDRVMVEENRGVGTDEDPRCRPGDGTGRPHTERLFRDRGPLAGTARSNGEESIRGAPGSPRGGHWPAADDALAAGDQGTVEGGLPEPGAESVPTTLTLLVAPPPTPRGTRPHSAELIGISGLGLASTAHLAVPRAVAHARICSRLRSCSSRWANGVLIGPREAGPATARLATAGRSEARSRDAESARAHCTRRGAGDPRSDPLAIGRPPVGAPAPDPPSRPSGTTDADPRDPTADRRRPASRGRGTGRQEGCGADRSGATGRRAAKPGGLPRRPAAFHDRRRHLSRESRHPASAGSPCRRSTTITQKVSRSIEKLPGRWRATRSRRTDPPQPRPAFPAVTLAHDDRVTTSQEPGPGERPITPRVDESARPGTAARTITTRSRQVDATCEPDTGHTLRVPGRNAGARVRAFARKPEAEGRGTIQPRKRGSNERDFSLESRLGRDWRGTFGPSETPTDPAPR
jgi:hypothetical protein